MSLQTNARNRLLDLDDFTYSMDVPVNKNKPIVLLTRLLFGNDVTLLQIEF